MSDKIKATYNANYNGWSVSVNGDDVDLNDTIIDKLVDYTGDYVDEDGEYEYGNCELLSTHEEHCLKLLRDKYGEDADITIELDSFST